MPCRSGSLIGITRITVRDAFYLTGYSFSLQGDEQALPIRASPKGCLEGGYQRHRKVIQCYSFDFHSDFSSESKEPKALFSRLLINDQLAPEDAPSALSVSNPFTASSIDVASRLIPGAGIPQKGQIFQGNSINRPHW